MQRAAAPAAAAMASVAGSPHPLLMRPRRGFQARCVLAVACLLPCLARAVITTTTTTKYGTAAKAGETKAAKTGEAASTKATVKTVKASPTKEAKEVKTTAAKQKEAPTPPFAGEGLYGHENCRCVGFGNLEGTRKVKVQDGTTVTIAADTGSSCQAWDEGHDPRCKAETSPSWCKKKWCYVNPCDCFTTTPPHQSKHSPNITFRGKPLFFSHATCEIPSKEDVQEQEDRAEACVVRRTADACHGMAKCTWVASKQLCVDTVLAKICHRKRKALPRGEAIGIPPIMNPAEGMQPLGGAMGGLQPAVGGGMRPMEPPYPMGASNPMGCATSGPAEQGAMSPMGAMQHGGQPVVASGVAHGNDPMELAVGDNMAHGHHILHGGHVESSSSPPMDSNGGGGGGFQGTRPMAPRMAPTNIAAPAVQGTYSQKQTMGEAQGARIMGGRATPAGNQAVEAMAPGGVGQMVPMMGDGGDRGIDAGKAAPAGGQEPAVGDNMAHGRHILHGGHLESSSSPPMGSNGGGGGGFQGTRPMAPRMAPTNIAPPAVQGTYSQKQTMGEAQGARIMGGRATPAGSQAVEAMAPPAGGQGHGPEGATSARQHGGGGGGGGAAHGGGDAGFRGGVATPQVNAASAPWARRGLESAGAYALSGRTPRWEGEQRMGWHYGGGGGGDGGGGSAARGGRTASGEGVATPQEAAASATSAHPSLESAGTYALSGSAGEPRATAPNLPVRGAAPPPGSRSAFTRVAAALYAPAQQQQQQHQQQQQQQQHHQQRQAEVRSGAPTQPKRFTGVVPASVRASEEVSAFAEGKGQSIDRQASLQSERADAGAAMHSSAIGQGVILGGYAPAEPVRAASSPAFASGAFVDGGVRPMRASIGEDAARMEKTQYEIQPRRSAEDSVKDVASYRLGSVPSAAAASQAHAHAAGGNYAASQRQQQQGGQERLYDGTGRTYVPPLPPVGSLGLQPSSDVLGDVSLSITSERISNGGKFAAAQTHQQQGQGGQHERLYDGASSNFARYYGQQSSDGRMLGDASAPPQVYYETAARSTPPMAAAVGGGEADPRMMQPPPAGCGSTLGGPQSARTAAGAAPSWGEAPPLFGEVFRHHSGGLASDVSASMGGEAWEAAEAPPLAGASLLEVQEDEEAAGGAHQHQQEGGTAASASTSASALRRAAQELFANIDGNKDTYVSAAELLSFFSSRDKDGNRHMDLWELFG